MLLPWGKEKKGRRKVRDEARRGPGDVLYKLVLPTENLNLRGLLLRL